MQRAVNPWEFCKRLIGLRILRPGSLPVLPESFGALGSQRLLVGFEAGENTSEKRRVRRFPESVKARSASSPVDLPDAGKVRLAANAGHRSGHVHLAIGRTWCLGVRLIEPLSRSEERR